MIVSLQCSGTDLFVAHTIMHELGHNLGLHHGGFEATNWKPNYNSVMNYRYSFPGVDTNCTPAGDGVLDYSRGMRPALNEASLSEPQGICGSPPGPGWDWNGDGDVHDLGLVLDVNVDGQGFGDGITQELRDFDDWGNLRLEGLSAPEGPLGPHAASRRSPAPVEVVTCTLEPPG
jgi:hypothetical protein